MGESLVGFGESTTGDLLVSHMIFYNPSTYLIRQHSSQSHLFWPLGRSNGIMSGSDRVYSALIEELNR